MLNRERPIRLDSRPRGMAEVEMKDKCTYPGCGLDDWHEGDHVPRLRLIQRYSWIHSYCEVLALLPNHRWCRKPSAAYWETAAGKGVELCAECEEELQEQGAMEVGPSAYSLAFFGFLGERAA